MQEEPMVFIIIANWKQYKLTHDTIRSVNQIDYQNFKIILVDNETNSKKLGRLKEQFPKVIIINNYKNLGYSKANNQGIIIALNKKADYILLLNNDVEVKKDFLTQLVNYSEKHSKNTILNPKILYHKKDIIWAMGGKLSLLTSIPRMIGQGKHSSEFKNPITADYANGCALFARAEIFKRVGLLNESMFAYYEDTDFSFRSKNLGIKIRAIPESIIWHKVSQSTIHKNVNKLSPMQSYLHAKNGLIFGYQNLKGLTKFYYIVSSLTVKTLLYLIFKCEGFNSKKEYLRGIKKGIAFIINDEDKD